MKRVLAFLLAVLLTCLGTVPAGAVFDQKDYYEMGIASLRDMTSQQAQQAAITFGKAGNYGEAKNYKQYAQALSDIFLLDEGGEPDLEMAAYRLSLLAEEGSFAASLVENALPSCDGLISYIEARLLEKEEDYASAWHCYAEIRDTLDAFDRQINLTGKAYEQGKAAYEAGEYEKAAKILKDLNWRDSEDLYAAILELMDIESEEDIQAKRSPMPVTKLDPESDLDPDPTVSPVTKITKTAGSTASQKNMDIFWNSSRDAWDILLDGWILSPDLVSLKKEMNDVFGKQGHTYNETSSDEAWWNVDETDLEFTFRNIPFDRIYVSRIGTWDGVILWRILSSGSSEGRTTVERLHSSLKEHFECTNVPVDGSLTYSTLDPGKSGDLDTLMRGDSFTLFYTYQSLSDKWNSRIRVDYDRLENYDRVRVWIGAYKETAAETYSVGDIITFGHYPQTASGTDSTAIEWRVLEVRDGKALLISRYALDCQQYHSSWKKVDWKDSSLRKWLNGDFMDQAFVPSEKKKIVTMEVSAEPNPKHGTPAGNSTKDNVFLLSIAETEKYFISDADRRCAPTEYAKAQGVGTDKNALADGKPACQWWLRSPGSRSDSAVRVQSTGTIPYEGSAVSLGLTGVRPAIWIDIGF